MAKTQVILTSNIVGLGAESDQVKVAAGYARNFLFPQRLAIPLTAANKRRLEALRQRRAEREAHEFNTMNELAKSLAKLICVVTVKTGEDGKMFGTVTNGAIADQLKTQFDVSLDKRKIHLDQPIKNLGEYEVELRLHPEVKGALKVRVESSTPPPPPAEAPLGEPPKEEGKRERRPWRGPRGVRPAADVKGEVAARTEGPARRPPRVERPAKAAKADKIEKVGEKPA